MKAAKPDNEPARLKALHDFGILDTLPEQSFDDIRRLASEICNTPVALVSFIDGERQWFKSKQGIGLDETPRDIAFCAHTILETDLLVVPDASQDRRFADNPLVRDTPAIRFYAGAPLVTAGGEALGTLCVIDMVRRTLTPDQEDSLRALSRQVMAQLELRRYVAEQARQQAILRAYQEQLEAANAQLERASLTDDVSGFHNTRYLHRTLDTLLAPSDAPPAPVSLAFFDMDRFKSVVDTHGHLLGARILREVAQAVHQALDDEDQIVRYGGDEYVVILPGQDAEKALVKVERMKERISQTPFLQHEGLDLRLTASFGLATYPDNAANKRQLLAAADRSLFRSKKQGRNRVTRAGANATSA